jgi:pimeloyl-ACP methyl ester carboxylesterase
MPGIIEQGTGQPIVLIPGIQGRWEWMAPTMDALAAHGRAITFSLCDEPTSGFGWSPERGFENYLSQLEDVLAATGADRPVLVGVSYGGLVAAEFASRHPNRVAGLVVASAPPPTWTPDRRVRRYLTAPRLLGPAFWAGAPMRAYPELKAAIPDLRARLRFALAQGLRVVAAPPSSGRMARRLEWLQQARFATDHQVDVPALVVTGEAALERVVPPQQTAEYLAWLPQARAVTMRGTGHAGSITQSRQFAALVGEFATGLREDVAPTRTARTPCGPDTAATGEAKPPARWSEAQPR